MKYKQDSLQKASFRNKRKGKRLTIGFAGVANFSSIIGQEIVAGIYKASEDFDVNLVNFIGVVKYSFTDDVEFFNHYKKKFKFINQNNIDGLICWASSYQPYIPTREIENFYQSIQPLPIVSIGVPMENMPVVLIDNSAGIKEIMDHLIKNHGYSKIGFIGCKGTFYYDSRLNTYKEVLAANEITYNKELVVLLEDLERKSVKQAVNELFIQRKLVPKKDIEAIANVSDIVAHILIDELENINIRVPNDIAVVGFNNQLDSIRSAPPITTVDPHFYQLGYKSVEILLNNIKNQESLNNEKKINYYFIPCDLIIRQSCGCLEDLIIKAEIKEESIGIHDRENKSFDISIKENYENIIAKLTDVIKKFNERFDSNHAKELLDCFLNDLSGKYSYKFLHTIKKYFLDHKGVAEDKLVIWQSVISEIRNLLLPFIMGNKEILPKVENIFHQSRLMIDVTNSYLMFSKRGDVYKLGTLARIAADFASAIEINRVISLIKVHLSDLEIPGIYLAIHDEIKSDIGKAHLILAYNKDGEISVDESNTYLQSGFLVSKKILPQTRRYSLMFELLFYKDVYIGFIIFEMGPLNMPLYDTVRTIVSTSLYSAMIMKEKFESVREKELLLKNTKISEIIKKESDYDISHDQKILNAHKILDYLCTHINDPTNLDKFALDFNVSKPSLVRKTKQLTGYSIQKLHELIKIERAKLLLENKLLNISEIADRLGYQNQFYFCHVFKKHTGLSPKKWIESNNK